MVIFVNSYSCDFKALLHHLLYNQPIRILFAWRIHMFYTYNSHMKHQWLFGLRNGDAAYFMLDNGFVNYICTSL